MTFDGIVKRLCEIGGERVEEDAVDGQEGVDFTELKRGDFTRRAAFVLPIERSYLELKAVSYTACRAIVVYVFEKDGEGDFALFGVPYLDYNYAQSVEKAILKNG